MSVSRWEYNSRLRCCFSRDSPICFVLFHPCFGVAPKENVWMRSVDSRGLEAVFDAIQIIVHEQSRRPQDIKGLESECYYSFIVQESGLSIWIVELLQPQEFLPRWIIRWFGCWCIGFNMKFQISPNWLHFGHILFLTFAANTSRFVVTPASSKVKASGIKSLTNSTSFSDIGITQCESSGVVKLSSSVTYLVWIHPCWQLSNSIVWHNVASPSRLHQTMLLWTILEFVLVR